MTTWRRNPADFRRFTGAVAQRAIRVHVAMQPTIKRAI
jgi:hypothetical protein